MFWVREGYLDVPVRSTTQVSEKVIGVINLASLLEFSSILAHSRSLFVPPCTKEGFGKVHFAPFLPTLLL